ncbi:MAG: hypothetical protein JXR51_03815 [Bacteroidales bacterium]|nr:hypothetical protein [Bacteroidales bacterium]MBN2756281.1 hypothetical protein [Bacteroidales bacterium]
MKTLNKEKENLFKSVSFEGVIADFAVIFIGFLIKNNTWWFQNNIGLIFWSVGILQCLMLYAIFLSYWSKDFNFENLPKFIKGIFGLVFILSIGGFMWIFLAADAIDIPNAWTIALVNFFVVIFGAWVALGLAMENASNENFFNKYIVLIIPSLYLPVSEILMVISAKAEHIGPWVAIFVISISYLPIRLLYMIKPPNSKIEMLTAALAFSYFIYILF